MHGDDPDQARHLDVLVREFFPDKTSHFRVRRCQLALRSHVADVGGSTVEVLKEHAFENGDFSRHTFRRPEVRRAEHAFGVVAQMEAFALETLDPLGTSRAVGSDTDVDDAVLFTPVASRFGNRQLALEELDCAVTTTEFLDDGVQLAGRKVGRCEFSTHDLDLLALICALSFSPNPRRNYEPVLVIARKGLLVSLFWLRPPHRTLVSKNCLYTRHPKYLVVNIIKTKTLRHSYIYERKSPFGTPQ